MSKVNTELNADIYKRLALLAPMFWQSAPSKSATLYATSHHDDKDDDKIDLKDINKPNTPAYNTPAYIADEALLARNLALLQGIHSQSSASILIALKGVSFYHAAPLISTYLNGATCSGLHEACLAYEELFSPLALARNAALFDAGIYHLDSRLCIDLAEDIMEASPKVLEAGIKREEKRLKKALKELYGIELEGALEGTSTLAEGQNYASKKPPPPYQKIVVFSPAYTALEIERLLLIASSIIFNSIAQLETFKDIILAHNDKTASHIIIGLRCNPLYSEVTPEIYNPCSPLSRLGVMPDELEAAYGTTLPSYIELLHFHTHCEQDSHALARTLPHIERHFGHYLSQVGHINLGGGHHITKDGYDTKLLVSLLEGLQARYGVEVELEPGEAIGLYAGYLASRVIDLLPRALPTAIMDTSAACHMPDSLEMPFTPRAVIASRDDKGGFALEEGRILDDIKEAPLLDGEYACLLGGATCLAGDIIGKYAFSRPLRVGDFVIFLDALHYSIVKNTTFNGMPLPHLALLDRDGGYRELVCFGYDEFKRRN